MDVWRAKEITCPLPHNVAYPSELLFSVIPTYSLILVPCATLNVVHFLLNKWRCLFSLALLTQILNGEDGLLANGSWECPQKLKDQTNTKMDGWMDDDGTLSTPIMHITQLGDLKVK
jgi:hypothetical protein